MCRKSIRFAWRFIEMAGTDKRKTWNRQTTLNQGQVSSRVSLQVILFPKRESTLLQPALCGLSGPATTRTRSVPMIAENADLSRGKSLSAAFFPGSPICDDRAEAARRPRQHGNMSRRDNPRSPEHNSEHAPEHGREHRSKNSPPDLGREGCHFGNLAVPDEARQVTPPCFDQVRSTDRPSGRCDRRRRPER